MSSISELMAALRGPEVGATATRLIATLLPTRIEPSDHVVGIVWATVDLERTLAEVAAPFVPAGRDRLLAGRAARVRCGRLGLVVEEPDSEGRLAANLARFGEGVAACYVEAPVVLHSASGPATQAEPTPLDRRGRLRRYEYPWGPFVIVLEGP